MRLSQVQAMAEQSRSSPAAGVVGGLASEVNLPSPSPPPERRIVRKAIGSYPFLCFKIRRPPPNVWPDNYLLDNLENIREEINTSPILRATLGGRHFKAYIRCNVNFIERKYTGSIKVEKITTDIIRILPMNKIMSERWMQTLVTDLGKRFDITKYENTNDWPEKEYIYTNGIEIRVEANEGKIKSRIGKKIQLIKKWTDRDRDIHKKHKTHHFPAWTRPRPPLPGERAVRRPNQY